MNVNLTPNITGKNVNIIKGANIADINNATNVAKQYRDEAEAFSIVSEAKSIISTDSATSSLASSVSSSNSAALSAQSSITAVNAANTVLSCSTQLNTVTNNIGDITTVSDNIISIGSVALISSDVVSVSDNIGNVDIVGSDLSNEYVYIEDNGSITSSVTSTAGTSKIKVVSDNITSVNTVSSNISSVVNISTNISDVISVSTNMTEVLSADTNAGIAITKASEASTSASDALIYRNQSEAFANSINPSNFVHISGTETITGNKTFSGTATLPSTTSIGNVSSTELGYIDGVTSSIQTQLDSKVAKVTSTDNAIVRFNGTTGDVQNSGVIIDDNGNIGLGITPDVNTTLPTIFGNYFMTAGKLESYTMANASYQSGVFTYLTTSKAASSYFQDNGTHTWKTATSGTAGNAINWTNAMTLGSNGNLLVGTSIDNGVDKLQVNGSISASNLQTKVYTTIVSSTLFHTLDTAFQTFYVVTGRCVTNAPIVVSRVSFYVNVDGEINEFKDELGNNNNGDRVPYFYIDGNAVKLKIDHSIQHSVFIKIEKL